MSTQKENTALTVQNQLSGYLAIANTDLAIDIGAEFTGMDIRFDKVKSLPGGACLLEVPSESGEPETVKEISGVIVGNFYEAVYYKDKYSGGSNPPDCSSIDAIHGTGEPGGDCRSCPFNQFGSGENGAKACHNKRRLLILRENELLPLELSVPTGSLKVFSAFITRQLSKGKKPSQYVTRFTLKKATSNSGIIYSQLQFTKDRDLTPEENAVVSTYAEQIKALGASIRFRSDEEVIITDSETGEVIESLGK